MVMKSEVEGSCKWASGWWGPGRENSVVQCEIKWGDPSAVMFLVLQESGW